MAGPFKPLLCHMKCINLYCAVTIMQSEPRLRVFEGALERLAREPSREKADSGCFNFHPNSTNSISYKS